MIPLESADWPYTQTSPVGFNYRTPLAGSITAIILAASLLESGTANTYENLPRVESTAANPNGYSVPAQLGTTGQAVLEIRRRSGLTWEELSDLFDVSRRSVHHWASGKPISAKNEQTVRRVLHAIRRLDQGNQAATRARLWAVDDSRGVSTFELLKHGRFIEVEAWVNSNWTPGYRPSLVSQAAQGARHSPAPTRILAANQDRPHFPAKARVARAHKSPKKMS